MKFHTATGSLYEIHEDTKQLRRSREGKADEWIGFDHLVPSPIKVGAKVIILGKVGSKNIMTSRVVKVEE